MILTRHHGLISSFVSCPVCFPCSFAPCYEVLMTPEPCEEFRYSGCGSSPHGLQRQSSCVCGYRCHLTLNCSSALRLELSVSFLLELRLVKLKIWFRTSLVQELENSTILPDPRVVLNDDEGGLCPCPPGV